MVKNKTGGSGHKGLARKSVNASKYGYKLRMALEEGEMYAVVIKVLGGSICSVLGSDNVTRSCVIRGKFRGGKKRDNRVSAGTLVLVGDREWASTSSKKDPVCDLLEVYSDIDKEKLKRSELNINWSFTQLNESYEAKPDNDITFSNMADNDYLDNMKNELENNVKNTIIDFDDGMDANVDVDDI
jgi:translation initiation factor IF-1